MRTGEYLEQLRRQQIVVYAEEGAVKIRASKDALSGEIIEEIKNRKQEILMYLDNAGQYKPVSIPRAAVKEYYPLSSAQKRLYFIHSLNRNSVLYNISFSVKMEGEVNTDKLQEAFRRLISRHESLRTSFVTVDHEVMQRVEENVKFSVDFMTVTEDVASAIAAYSKPFEMDKAPLIRAGMFTTGTAGHLLRVEMHHIIADGFSNSILLKEFMELYREQELPEISLQYKDFSVWQQSPEAQQKMSAQKDFWKAEFSEEPPVLELPTDFTRPVQKNEAGNNLLFKTATTTTALLRKTANANQCSLFTVLLSAFSVLLSKLSSQKDIVIGIPAAGRQHDGLEQVVGMFVNTLPVRTAPDGEMTFKSFLESMRAKLLSVLDSQDYQYEYLLNDLQLSGVTNRNPLFDVMFVFENAEDSVLELPGLKMSGYFPPSSISKFDLSLLVTERKEELEIRFEYATALFRQETIERFAGYLKSVIEAITGDVNIRIADINILSDAEKYCLLKEFNDTVFEYPQTDTIIEMFERQAHQTPDATAVCSGASSLSYRQLNEMTDGIAGRILNSGKVTTGSRVAFIYEPSVELVAAMLAIVKAGCTYVPLAPDAPDARNRFIYEDCEAALLLIDSRIYTDEKTEQDQSWKDKDIIVTETFQQSDHSVYTFEKPIKPAELIYLIYTSGTTGTPKGVEVTTAGILNMIHYFRYAFNLREGTVVSQAANISFDASAFEIWPCLTCGGTLHIATPEARYDAGEMMQWLINHSIEITFQTPHMAESLLMQRAALHNSSLKVFNVAGDIFNYFPDKPLPFRLYNLYGPTEDAVWTTWHELRHDRPMRHYTIGKPIGNKQIFILDSFNKLVPAGVAGELCIGGAGLAKGYINNPSLTASKFTDHPFQQGAKIYRTGDRARWAADGNIEYLGRIDEQVKLRGYRIELREIELQLKNLAGVKESVVVVADNNGNRQLAAYYLSAETISYQVLRKHLRENLPDYMIPAFFIRLDEFPLTQSGKIDRKKLPAPGHSGVESFISPSTTMEKELTAIWADVLGLKPEQISVTMNYFELGGNSMNILKLNSKVNYHFQCNIPVAEMFMLPTIQEMQLYIANGGKDISTVSGNIDDAINEAEDNLRLMQNI